MTSKAKKDTKKTLVLDTVNGSRHIVGSQAGLNYQKACETISVAISKLGARRIEGYITGDQELIKRMTSAIARAHAALGDLTPDDPRKVRRRQTEYLEMAQNTPHVAPEILLRYHQMLAEGQVPGQEP